MLQNILLEIYPKFILGSKNSVTDIAGLHQCFLVTLLK